MLEATCRRHSVPLVSAALQFPSKHPAKTTVLAGMRSPEAVRTNADLFDIDIPSEFWAKIADETLIPRT